MQKLRKLLMEYKFLIVDDHPLFREGLHRILSDIGIEDISEASSGEKAVDLAEKLKPDIILMDLYMPGLNGIEVTKKILTQHPSTLIIMLTVSEDDNIIAEALQAGAQGFLNKNMHSDDIINSLCSLLTGKIPLSKPMTRKMLIHLTANTKTSFKDSSFNTMTSLHNAISPREKEILALLAQGMSNKEIAKKLYISEYTVKNHVRNILDKLHVRSRTQAVVYAMVNGLI